MSPSHGNTETRPRNPGPGWGYSFLRLCDHLLPERIFRPARALGTWIAMMYMPEQYKHSSDYLRILFGREPTCMEVFHHFFEFEEFLMLKLRIVNGRRHFCRVSAESVDFDLFLNSDESALLGTFHFGHSDLLGFLLGGKKRQRVAMVRQKVGNSEDTDQLGKLFSQWVSFIWVNSGEDFLFALKDAIGRNESVALKCDRVEFSAKTEAFDFLKARRVFPFTIYHLALLFNKPVLLSIGIPGSQGESIVSATPRWLPDPLLTREENLRHARAHFQHFLHQMETHLMEHPFCWFNFLELNPEAVA